MQCVSTHAAKRSNTRYLGAGRGVLAKMIVFCGACTAGRFYKRMPLSASPKGPVGGGAPEPLPDISPWEFGRSGSAHLAQSAAERSINGSSRQEPCAPQGLAPLGMNRIEWMKRERAIPRFHNKGGPSMTTCSTRRRLHTCPRDGPHLPEQQCCRAGTARGHCDDPVILPMLPPRPVFVNVKSVFRNRPDTGTTFLLSGSNDLLLARSPHRSYLALAHNLSLLRWPAC